MPLPGGRASDERGEQVAERPVYPWDLIGSMYELLGIDAEAKIRHPQGQLVSVTPSAKEGYDIGGRLQEIM